MKVDLHVHTTKSSDAHTRPEELVPYIQRAGLDGVAVTDHNVLATDVPNGAIVIPGIEISSSHGHIIALGISRPIPRGLSGDETIQEIRKLGGVSIVAHPYDFFRSAIRPETLTILPDAIEIINSASMFHNITWKRAKAFAEKHQLPQTGGSDSHIPQTIGRAFTVINSESRTVQSILDAMRKGFVIPQGRPYNLMDRLRKLSGRSENR